VIAAGRGAGRSGLVWTVEVVAGLGTGTWFLLAARQNHRRLA